MRAAAANFWRGTKIMPPNCFLTVGGSPLFDYNTKSKNKIMAKKQILKLKGKAVVFVDWANIYGWKKTSKKSVDPKILYKYLKTYPEIKSINFYYGKDKNKKSKEFLKQIKKISYKLTTKPVKYIVVGKVAETIIRKRKCDFDMEICMATYSHLEKNFETFIFFSGDGDFEPLYKHLIKNKKQVIVIYEKGHLGREIWKIKKGLFKTRFTYLKIGKK